MSNIGFIVIFIVILLFIGAYLYMICPGLKRKDKLTPFIHMEWAHRGLHNVQNLIPENSMAAFRCAVEQHYGIELDVRLTKDTRVVVFHDSSLERVCGVNQKVEDLTYEELQKCYLSGTYEKIPLLSEVLDYVNGRVPLLIEIKMDHRSARICDYLKAELEKYQGAYLIQSFNSIALRWFMVNAPEILRGQLASNLTAKKEESPYLVRFLVKHLLTNCYCRPDFISYKLIDSHILSLWLNKHLFKVPCAAWTLRTPEALAEAKEKYDMYIFEKKY